MVCEPDSPTHSFDNLFIIDIFIIIVVVTNGPDTYSPMPKCLSNDNLSMSMVRASLNE